MKFSIRIQYSKSIVLKDSGDFSSVWRTTENNSKEVVVRGYVYSNEKQDTSVIKRHRF